MTAVAGGDPAVAIAAVGAFSPLGPTWRQTCASVRAGLNRFGDHPWYEALTPDQGWDEPDPLRCSLVPGWNETLDDPDRLAHLALEALRDLLAQAPLRRAELGAGGIVLALPGEREVPGAADDDDGVLARVLDRSGLDGLAHAEVLDGGPAGFFPALGEVARRLRAGELSFCLVGGVDSYFIDSRLDALDRAWRLRTGRNPDGFIPGEAAVLLLAAAPRWMSAAGLAPLCTVGAPGVGREPETILGDRASSGAGLATAIAAATGRAPAPPWVLCDLNGESYRAFEWGVAQARLAPALDELRVLQHPADCSGPTGWCGASSPWLCRRTSPPSRAASRCSWHRSGPTRPRSSPSTSVERAPRSRAARRWPGCRDSRLELEVGRTLWIAGAHRQMDISPRLERQPVEDLRAPERVRG